MIRDREAQKLYAREYIQRDYVKDKRKAYALLNKAKQPEYIKTYKLKHPEQQLLDFASWILENKKLNI